MPLVNMAICFSDGALRMVVVKKEEEDGIYGQKWTQSENIQNSQTQKPTTWDPMTWVTHDVGPRDVGPHPVSRFSDILVGDLYY